MTKTILKYGNVELQPFGDYNLQDSSQEVTYSDIECDFTGKSKDDLPQKYQEVKIITINDLGIEKVNFFGFINDYYFNEMREQDIETSITISLFSPYEMTTLRTATAIGTYKIENLLNLILEPLIEDGYTIKEMNVNSNQINVNYLVETIEYCMNNLSNKFNFWWHIDKYKNIYIKDIENMMKKEPDYTYNDNSRIPGLEYIKPSTSSENYANVVNFKNVRIYEYSRAKFNETNFTENHNSLLENQIETLSQNSQIDFKFPVDITKENVLKSAQSNGIFDEEIYALYITGKYSDGSDFELYIKYIWTIDSYVMSSNIGFNGNENDNEKEFLLIRDSLFNNLIVGLRFNNENKNISKITEIKSDSALIWNVNKLYNDKAIEEKRGIISKTGIVEITVDMNESWKTIQELRDIGISYMNKNSIEYANNIEIGLDQDVIKVGDLIYINKFFINGNYIITSVQENYSNNDFEYVAIAKNANLLENFIDVFRGENTQEQDDKNTQIYITHYAEEGIEERFEVFK